MNCGSLLELVQGLLERTYRMSTGVQEIGRFVIGDEGYRTLYREVHAVASGSAFSPSGRGARTLVRETEEGVRACIYYPDEMIHRLEVHPPLWGLGDENVDEFATLVEELDHLLCIAERSRENRPLTLFELELHANVSKYLVLSRFLSGPGRPLNGRRRTWLLYHLFHKGTAGGEDAEVRARYRDAARWALRLLEVSSQMTPPMRRVETLRRFHAATASGKLELIERLSSAR